MIFNIVDLAKVEDEVISVEIVTEAVEVGTSDICVRGYQREVGVRDAWPRALW